jgi:hypothetical protein
MKKKQKIKALKELIRHCWVHSGYRDCGWSQMTAEQRVLYEKVIGRKSKPHSGHDGEK